MKCIALLGLCFFLFSCGQFKRQTVEIQELRRETFELHQKIDEIYEKITYKEQVTLYCNCTYRYRDTDWDIYPNWSEKYNDPVYEEEIKVTGSGPSIPIRFEN